MIMTLIIVTAVFYKTDILKQLERLIRKYEDNITIKVAHYISGNLDSGVIGS